jgi:very-long-chain ceramide synthase
MIATVVALYINWEIFTPLIAPGLPNPFAPLIFISHRIQSSSPEDPRYAKGYLDLVFIAFYIVVFSFLRQVFMLHVFHPLARWYGIKRSKFDRFGEQGYAIIYWGTMSVWGYVSFFYT